MDTNLVIITGNLCEDAKIMQRNDRNGRSQDYAMVRVGNNTGAGDYKRTDFMTVAVFNDHLVKLMREHGRKGTKVCMQCELAQHRTGSGQEQRDELRLRIGAHKGDIQLLNSPTAAAGSKAQSDPEQQYNDPDDDIPL
ncbi:MULTISPECIES: single-stranded DNA-binding protein [Alphaproteobacteria]|jgi:single-stranded DNA-binding protein|uniref:Single-stranded DNA-binding protein n=1 Tax=Maricaulis virginensis TaxID=144022 RepID=A0A9W6IND2_9PROT|nr:single-stranded DNA-binding protein [Maricaulis virginensis]GLK53522.1 hypothetical protein GCM10017621_30300 [Maricaulis virginensis]